MCSVIHGGSYVLQRPSLRKVVDSDDIVSYRGRHDDVIEIRDVAPVLGRFDPRERDAWRLTAADLSLGHHMAMCQYMGVKLVSRATSQLSQAVKPVKKKVIPRSTGRVSAFKTGARV